MSEFTHMPELGPEPLLPLLRSLNRFVSIKYPEGTAHRVLGEEIIRGLHKKHPDGQGFAAEYASVLCDVLTQAAAAKTSPEAAKKVDPALVEHISANPARLAVSALEALYMACEAYGEKFGEQVQAQLVEWCPLPGADLPLQIDTFSYQSPPD